MRIRVEMQKKKRILKDEKSVQFITCLQNSDSCPEVWLQVGAIQKIGSYYNIPSVQATNGNVEQNLV